MSLTKSQMAAWVRSGRGHESFEHEYLGEFNVTLTLIGIFKKEIPYEICRAVIDERTKYISQECREVDQARVAELVKEGALDEPILIVHDPSDDTDVIIDGTHRLAGRIARGDKEFLFFRIALKDAVRIERKLYSRIREYGDQKFIERNKGKDHSSAPKHKKEEK